jgi:2'-5' RNA ligase
VRWVPAEQWHITLRFLGEADEDAATRALQALRAAPAAVAVVGPRVSRLGRAVVCLPVTGLDRLATEVAVATAQVGEPPDGRFSGHLTLARLRRRAACGVTGTAFHATFTVDNVALVRSTPGAEGAHHELVTQVALEG